MLKKDINKYNTAQPSGRPMGRTDGETARGRFADGPYACNRRGAIEDNDRLEYIEHLFA